jgi:multisubunit Na+/H+ antiporter MnhG subunit
MVFPRDDPTASREDHPGGGLSIDYQGWLACATAVVGFLLCLAGWWAGGGAVSLPFIITFAVLGIVFVAFTSPVSGHAIARAAHHRGKTPQEEIWKDSER